MHSAGARAPAGACLRTAPNSRHLLNLPKAMDPIPVLEPCASKGEPIQSAGMKPMDPMRVGLRFRGLGV